MPRQQQAQPSPSFTWGNAINLAAIPLVTAGVFFIGQWFVSGDTLKRHGSAIEKFELNRDEEKKAREAVRDEFLKSQRQLVEVLGKLDTRLSVGEKQQESMSRQIEKISDILQRPASTKR